MLSMRSLSPRARRVAVALPLALAAASACNNAPVAPHGPPTLTQAYWVSSDGQQLVYSSVDSTAIAVAVPPLGAEIDFVFDRRLDGDRIEDTVTVNGVVTTVPKRGDSGAPMPPVSVSWPGPGGGFDLFVLYNSVARFGGESSYVFARPGLPGFPSDSTLTFKLNREQLTSAYGEPLLPLAAGSPDSFVVKTAAFAVTINVPAGASGTGASVGTDFKVPLTFNNRVQVANLSSLVHVRAPGGEVPFKLLPDTGNSARLYVAPADCLGAWPGNTAIEVRVDAGFPDAFGGKLAAAVTASFTTGAGGGNVDASCPLPDAAAVTDGAADAGADMTPGGDAASDGGVTPDGAAATEAGGGSDGGVTPDGAGDAAMAGDAAAEAGGTGDGGAADTGPAG
jgi:hypothetical protein